jgi:hypothetical protein
VIVVTSETFEANPESDPGAIPSVTPVLAGAELLAITRIIYPSALQVEAAEKLKLIWLGPAAVAVKLVACEDGTVDSVQKFAAVP